MESYGINILVEAKNEYTKQLTSLLTPKLYERINKIFFEALSQENTDYVLKNFQSLLKNIPDWSENKINNESKEILDNTSCNWFEDLITAVFVSNTRILTSVQMGKSSEKIKLEIPTNNRFIHTCLIECAREFYKNPYLFDNNNLVSSQVHRNLRDSLNTIENCISNAIRKLLPFQQILKKYLGNGNNNSIEDSVNNKSLERPNNNLFNKLIRNSLSDDEDNNEYIDENQENNLLYNNDNELTLNNNNNVDSESVDNELTLNNNNNIDSESVDNEFKNNSQNLEKTNDSENENLEENIETENIETENEKLEINIETDIESKNQKGFKIDTETETETFNKNQEELKRETEILNNVENNSDDEINTKNIKILDHSIDDYSEDEGNDTNDEENNIILEDNDNNENENDCDLKTQIENLLQENNENENENNFEDEPSTLEELKNKVSNLIDNPKITNNNNNNKNKNINSIKRIKKKYITIPKKQDQSSPYQSPIKSLNNSTNNINLFDDADYDSDN